MKTAKIIKPTLNQKKVIDLTYENLCRDNKVNKGEVLAKSGYSKSVQHQPEIVYESKAVQQGLKTITDKLIEERDKAIIQAQKQRGKATYSNCIEAIDKLTKNIQLLQGNATEIIEQRTPEEIEAFISFKKKLYGL